MWFSKYLSDVVLKALTAEGRARWDKLSGPVTPREQSIIRLIADGQSNKRMALILGISLKTVEAHRANLMRKLEIKSTASLVRYAVRNHIVEA